MPSPDFTPGRFIAYDISPVAEFNSGTCEAFASLNEARRASDKTFWSLYGIAPSREVTCIGDYRDYAAAAEIYHRITGCFAPPDLDGSQQLNLPNGQ